MSERVSIEVFSRDLSSRTLLSTMSHQDKPLTPGTLWPAFRERTEQARRCEAILSIPTATETIEQGGVTFVIRVVVALARMTEAAPLLLARYETLLHRAQVPISRTPDGVRTGPYNLLVTRQSMLLVPRSVECFEGLSINALGFAGGLLVRDEAQLEILKAHGPMTALRQVSVPRQP